MTNPVDPATAGAVAGKVTFMGTPPPAETISMSSDPRCVNAGAKTEAVVVAGDGSLQNVFVYVKDGLGALKFPVPATPLVLDQKGCQYRPHVFGVQVGQPIEILNSDATLHNIHAWPQANAEFNKGQALQGMKDTHVFSTHEVMVPFKCDVHRWMNSFVGVRRPSVLRRDRRRRLVPAQGPAAGHLHDRGLAREVRHEDGQRDDRRQGNEGRRVHVQRVIPGKLLQCSSICLRC